MSPVCATPAARTTPGSGYDYVGEPQASEPDVLPVVDLPPEVSRVLYSALLFPTSDGALNGLLAASPRSSFFAKVQRGMPSTPRW